jgi:DNA topoisomerase VI subunit A
MSTRILLKKLEAKYNIPIYAIVDHNVFGIQIWLTYMLGSGDKTIVPI